MINPDLAAESADATSKARSCWLPGQRKSVGEARSLLREYLADVGGGDELLAVGELVLSELVSNAVLHAKAPGRLIKVNLRPEGAHLRIEVHDASVEPPVLRSSPDTDDDSGRGLCLVDALSITWGCHPRPEGIGKIVWALCGPKGGA